MSNLPIFNNDHKVIAEELTGSLSGTNGGDFKDPTDDKVANSTMYRSSLQRNISTTDTFGDMRGVSQQTRYGGGGDAAHPAMAGQQSRTSSGVSDPGDHVPGAYPTAHSHVNHLNKDAPPFVPPHYQAHPFGVSANTTGNHDSASSNFYTPAMTASGVQAADSATSHHNPFQHLMDQLPTHEHPSGSSVGVGSLPGDINEPGVATLPEEREGGKPYGTYRTGFENYSPAKGALHRQGADKESLDMHTEPLTGHLAVHEHNPGVEHHVGSKWEMPSTETPSESRGGVGSLPGKKSEDRVAMLPEERIHPADDILGSHLPPRLDEMPLFEHPSGSIVGVGSLPGKRNEQRVAMTPEERLHPADDILGSHLPPRMDEMPLYEHPSGSIVGVGSLPGGRNETGVALTPEERIHPESTAYFRSREAHHAPPVPSRAPPAPPIHPSRQPLRREQSTQSLDMHTEPLTGHVAVHEHVAGVEHHVGSKWEMPSSESASGARCGVGSLPGKKSEQGVAMLPEERLFPADEIMGSHLPPRMDQMPLFEHTSGAVVGVGSLPGGHNERAVALTPEERLHPADEILGSHLPPRWDQLPLHEHPSGSPVGVGSLPGPNNERGVAVLPDERHAMGLDHPYRHRQHTKHAKSTYVRHQRSHPHPSQKSKYAGNMPSTEHPSGSRGGVGSLPGKRGEQGVAMLPEERLHSASGIMDSHLPPGADQLPTTEHPSLSKVGCGSLPGSNNEPGVAILPDERPYLMRRVHYYRVRRSAKDGKEHRVPVVAWDFLPPREVGKPHTLGPQRQSSRSQSGTRHGRNAHDDQSKGAQAKASRSRSPITIFNADRRLGKKQGSDTRDQSGEGEKTLGDQVAEDFHRLEDTTSGMIHNIEEGLEQGAKKAKEVFYGVEQTVQNYFLPHDQDARGNDEVHPQMPTQAHDVQPKVPHERHGRARSASDQFKQAPVVEKGPAGFSKAAPIAQARSAAAQPAEKRVPSDESDALDEMLKEAEAKLEAAKEREEKLGVKFGAASDVVDSVRTPTSSPYDSPIAQPTVHETPMNIRTQYLASDISREAPIGGMPPRAPGPSTAQGREGVEFDMEGRAGHLPGYPSQAGMTRLVQERMRDDQLRAMGRDDEIVHEPTKAYDPSQSATLQALRTQHTTRDSSGRGDHQAGKVAPTSMRTSGRDHGKLSVDDLGTAVDRSERFVTEDGHERRSHN